MWPFNILAVRRFWCGERDYLKAKVLTPESRRLILATTSFHLISGLIHATFRVSVVALCTYSVASMSQVKNQSRFFQHVFLVASQ